MIETWQIMLLIMSLWFIYSITKPIVRPNSVTTQLKHKINMEIDIGLNREKQDRIRLGLQPLFRKNNE